MTTITVQTPRTVATPRGAAWGAWLFHKLSLAVSRLLVRAYAAHDERALRRQLTLRIGDARQVREYARSVMRYDARFAADLYAAADRHEHFGK